MPWADIEEVEHLPRRGLLRDGRLILFPRDGSAHVTTPLGLVTTVSGADGDLTAALAELAGERCAVVEIVPAVDDEVEDGVEVLEDEVAEETVVIASPTPSALREATTAIRADDLARTARSPSPRPTAVEPTVIAACTRPPPSSSTTSPTCRSSTR